MNQTAIARRSTDGVAITCLSISLPVPNAMRVLSTAERALLNLILRRRNEYVDHAVFEEPGLEKELFGFDGGQISNSVPTFRWGVELAPSVAKSKRPTALSANDETRLFMRFNYARYRVATVLMSGSGGALTLEQARALLMWESRASAMREAIVEANLRLVLMMIKRFKSSDVDMSDLISDGCVTLLACVDRFDCSRGFKFSTYACLAIRKSLAEVATRTNRYRGWFPYEFNPDFERSNFAELQRLNVESGCIDELRTILHQNLAQLNDAERIVIRERFALELDGVLTDQQPRTLDSVGQLLGVTKERARQIQNKALRKIRATLNARYFAA